MGYYSEAVLYLSKDAHEFLFKEIDNKASDELKHEISELFSEATCHMIHQGTNEGARLYHWPTIKWHLHYREVKYMVHLIMQLNDRVLRATDGCRYCFIRLGSDIDDNVMHGGIIDNPFDIQIKREILFTLPEYTQTNNKESTDVQ